MIKRLVRYYVPSHVASGTALYDGMAFKVSSLLTTTFISFFYIFLCLFVDFTVGVYSCLFFLFTHIGLLFSFKNGYSSDKTITHLFGSMSMIGLSACSFYTGGYESPVLFWFLTTLVVSFWFSDFETSRLWMGIVLLLMSLFFMGYAIDYQFPVALNTELFGFFKFSMSVGIFCFLIVVFKTFESWRQSALKELSEINATKDRMMSMVAHDLKNPLMIMMGHIGLAKAGKPLNEKSLILFESLNSRMKQIIDNMLIFERLQAGQYQFNFKDLQINQVVLDLIEEFRDQATQKNIQLKFISHHQLNFRSDQLALERIISNVISNALKYTPSHKSVTVSILSNGVSVVDEGIGLSDEVKRSLFEIYSKSGGRTQHLSDQSNGIGLYIVKQLSDQLGIRLEVESPGLDQGSTFTLRFS